MNIRYEIIRMFCMLIVFVTLYAPIVKIFGDRSWKLSIIRSLSAGIMLFILDSLFRYFGLV
ncbi:Uncharacterised protein [Candidatus Bartonella washoeensis]|uniref:Uncharacterized protein n=1 Tax=Cardidatus Bartonella washoeensis 085-0475 TaxID=1094564 RepID=J0Z9L8_9HYPH|nr:hypothetical protein MCW_01173 [Bartonella washoeensis 085-0475]SPU26833.1 Uncharacterised protein [Bartonella washoeensis]